MTNDHKLDNLKTPEICSLTVLSRRSTESKAPTWPLSSSRPQDGRHALSLPTLGGSGNPLTCVSTTPPPSSAPPQATSGVPGPLSSACLPGVIGFRAYPENRGWSPYLKIPNLFIVIKTHFPHKIWKLQQFQDVWTCLFGGHHSIHCQCQNKEVKIIDRNDGFACDKHY